MLRAGTSKCKLRAGAVKHKLGLGPSNTNLGREPGLGLRIKARAGGWETQIPFLMKSILQNQF